MAKTGMTQEELERKEHGLVRTNVELFIKDFCKKLEAPKGIGDLFPYQELAAQLLDRYSVKFREEGKKAAEPTDGPTD